MALVALGVVVVVGGLAIARWKKRRAEQGADLAATTGTLDLSRARAIAAKLDRTVYVDPLPLTTRLDARFKCDATDFGPFSCGGAGWESIVWKLERDTSNDSIDALLASAHPHYESAADALESGSGGYDDVDVAGFRGFIFVNFATRMPVTDVTFTGYRDDPHGRVKLTIGANGWRSANSPGSTDVADAIAIMLSTRVEPSGLPAHLPDPQDLYKYADASRGMGALLDDAKPDGWIDGASRFANAKSQATDALGDYFARATPIVVSLVWRRLNDHPPDAAGYLMAARLAESLFALDAKEGTSAADFLAGAITGGWTFTQADAAAWVEAELRLAALRTRASNGADPSRATALRLAPMDRRAVLHDPRGSLDLLAEKLRGPEAAKLLEAWLDPAGFPPDADFGGVAAFAMSHLRMATVKRHALAMLSDKRHAGDIEPRSSDVLFRGVSQHGYPATNLPPTKSTRDFRVCDVYAGEDAERRAVQRVGGRRRSRPPDLRHPPDPRARLSGAPPGRGSDHSTGA